MKHAIVGSRLFIAASAFVACASAPEGGVEQSESAEAPVTSAPELCVRCKVDRDCIQLIANICGSGPVCNIFTGFCTEAPRGPRACTRCTRDRDCAMRDVCGEGPHCHVRSGQCREDERGER